ncbi:PQQ-dependent sugar dehydrogenase [Pseudochryseolinea flava]|uniref:PQQ-dependent sugar dehydrogenase n=2 Tax=Pseudochryseolinea flava TaxID=2059302 RepID=A0A364Y5K3_9BACT|nr:PQQ-dependent sugar dehydrogenase [Pseudochryseolinea flava]
MAALVPILFCSGKHLHSQSLPVSERMAIESVIHLYFDGWATGDTAKLAKAMHSTCELKFFREGKFTSMARAAYLNLHKVHVRNKDLITHIVNLDVTGNVGSSKVELITVNGKFTDYFNVMKDGEHWYIVDKVSTYSPNKIFEKSASPEKEIILDQLKRPWSIVFLSEEEVLITEKEGDLIKANLRTKERIKIGGFPSDMADSIAFFHPGDNTGKFEILLDPDFNKNKWVYLSYAAKNEKGMATKIIRATLDNNTLTKIQTLFIGAPHTFERVHYGGGMAFGGDGKLYFILGERIFSEKSEPALPIAQNVKDRRGKIYRINSDGTIPNDNPDFGKDAVAGLYAIGIRAAQGMILNPATKSIWFSEHGTHQGDEINILSAGANYGWPLKTTGKYRYADYVPPSTNDVLTEPVWSWLHTVAPTGLLFYTGEEFSSWKNSLLVCGLSRGSFWRLTVDGDKIKSAEELFVDDRKRLRKVVQSPDGKLYVLTDEMNGLLIRIKNRNG